MSIDWTPLADAIEANDRFLVTTHVRPDGDALGSEVGMVGLLRQRGKDVRVVNASPTPPRYDYLDPSGTLFEHYGVDVRDADLADRQALVILDLSSWGQLADFAGFVRAFPGTRLVVDHHVSQDDMGAAYLKDTTAEATGTLVARAIKALGLQFTPEISSGLLTAIAMDTGWFRHPSTSPETFRTAAELVEAGGSVSEIYRILFERSTLGRLKLTGVVLSDLALACDGRVAYTKVSLAQIAAAGAIPADTEDLVDYTVSLAGVEVGLMFIEQKGGGVKVSFRSRAGLDVSSAGRDARRRRPSGRGRRDDRRADGGERPEGHRAGPVGARGVARRLSVLRALRRPDRSLASCRSRSAT